MANNSKYDGSTPGYQPTAKVITKGEQSAPGLKDGDTADNEARGNIKLASEQKGVLTRSNSGDVSNRMSKYKY